MIEKGKRKKKRVVPAPGIEGRDDGFHDGRMGRLGEVDLVAMELERTKSYFGR